MVPAGWHTLGISTCWHAFDHLPGLFHANEKTPFAVPSQHVPLSLTARTEHCVPQNLSHRQGCHQTPCWLPPSCTKHEQNRKIGNHS